MFQHFKSKAKTPSLRIHLRSADSKAPGQRVETISMASMPLVPQTEPSAVLHDNGPKLFITGDRVTTGSSAPPAK